MNRYICSAVVVVILSLICCSVYATNIPTYDSNFVEISNLIEYRYCPYIGPWEMHGFYPSFSGTNTPYITPTFINEGAKLIFDFKSGYAGLGRDYAWAQPTNTPCEDVTSAVVFDWCSYVSPGVSPYLTLELWGEHGLYGPSDPYLIWSIRPGAGIRSAHVELSNFYSYNYIEFRVGYQPVPEPSTCCAMLTMLMGAVAAVRHRKR